MTRTTTLRTLKPGLWRWSTTVSALVLLTAAGAPAAQSPPPVQGTIALEGTMEKFYRAANVVVVTTVDGVERVYHFGKDLVVHSGKGKGMDALEGLREGSTVVVHYTVRGAEQTASELDIIGSEGLKVTEGVATRVDRGRKQITVRYDDGRTETFKLTERAAAETTDEAVPGGTEVLIYYSNEDGHKVAHFFRPLSQ